MPSVDLCYFKYKKLGASVKGKPTVSKTVTAGSIPAAPEEKK